MKIQNFLEGPYRYGTFTKLMCKKDEGDAVEGKSGDEVENSEASSFSMFVPSCNCEVPIRIPKRQAR